MGSIILPYMGSIILPYMGSIILPYMGSIILPFMGSIIPTPYHLIISCFTSSLTIQGITLAKDVKLKAELYSIQEILSRGFV